MYTVIEYCSINVKVEVWIIFGIVKRMKWSVFPIVMLIILLLNPLMYSSTQSLGDRSVKLAGSINYETATVNGYVNVNVSEAKQMIETNAELVILDVRTLEEYNEGHIENAVLIPVSELESRLDELDKEKETLAYCKLGGRSATASQILVDHGFSSVYNMLGGITAWRNEGYWIEITHEGDLIIDGTQEYIIESCRYIQTGNILVKDTARLSITNAMLMLNQNYRMEYEIQVEDYAELKINSTEIVSEFGCFIHFWDDSKANLNNSTLIGVQVEGSSEVMINNSQIQCFGSEAGNSQTLISNSHLSSISLWFEEYSIAQMDYLKPGLVKYWSLRVNETVIGEREVALENTWVEGWTIRLVPESIVKVSNSTLQDLSIDLHSTSCHIDNLKPGLHYHWNLNAIELVNTYVEKYGLHVHSNVVSIANSEIYIGLFGSSNVSLTNSTIVFGIAAEEYKGTLFLNQTTWKGGFEIIKSAFFVYGGINLTNVSVEWVSSNVTRNYNLIVRNISDIPVDNVELTVFNVNDTVIWNGFTDNLGEASFNLTFTDNNHTDTLRLEAVKGNYSATIDIGFLSDTPVVLTLRYYTDLNGDSKINIVDLFVVAKAFGTKEGDPNYNSIADIDNNNEINIVDLYEVARDYGKTV